MKLDGYIRVSRVGGRNGDTFISPEVQREQIEQWAAMRGASILAWHTDLDVSGGKLKRPGLDALLQRLRDGETGGIAVARLDRLSRAGVADALKLVEGIHELGGAIAAIDLGIDPLTPFGEFAMTVMLGLARMERRRIAESWHASRERAITRGVHIASTTPTGYQRADDGRLEPDPGTAPVVRELFERRAAGAPWVELAELLNERGVPARYSTGQWTGATVARLIANRTYLGDAHHGEFVKTDAHSALVPAAVWHAAQQARGAAVTRSVRAPALLSGLVRCAGCGYGMYRGTGRGANKSVVVHYRCRGNHSAGKCPERAYAHAWELEAFVASAFLARWDHMQARASADSPALDAALDALSEAREALRVFRDDPRVIATLGADGFAEGLRERVNRVDACNAAVEDARRAVAGLPDAQTLRSVWETANVEERRRLLTHGVDCAIVFGRGPVTPDRVRVCWTGTMPTGLPRRGGRGSRLCRISADELPADTRVAVSEKR